MSQQNDCHWVLIEKMSFTINLFINSRKSLPVMSSLAMQPGDAFTSRIKMKQIGEEERNCLQQGTARSRSEANTFNQ